MPRLPTTTSASNPPTNPNPQRVTSQNGLPERNKCSGARCKVRSKSWLSNVGMSVPLFLLWCSNGNPKDPLLAILGGPPKKGLWMDEIHCVPPKKPWIGDSPANTLSKVLIFQPWLWLCFIQRSSPKPSERQIARATGTRFSGAGCGKTLLRNL